MEDRPVYQVDGQRIAPETLLAYRDPRYRPPTPAEIRVALRIADLTGSAAGQLLGVDSRTVRRWTGGDREMPYAAWRLLLQHIGAVESGSSTEKGRSL